MPSPFPDLQTREQIIKRLRRGLTYRQILAEVDTSMGLITNVIRFCGGVVPKPKKRSSLRLSLAEREQIARCLDEGLSFREIAEELRTSYELAYYPTNRAKDDAFRKVTIRPKRDDVKIRCKTGYFAGPVKTDPQ